MKKQDRQGARTVAELNRRYNVKKSFEKAMGVANDSIAVASSAQATASTANQAASEAQSGLGDKVGRTENDYVVEMINAATTVLKLTLNRLIVESDNFKLLEDGSVEISGTVTAQEGKIGDWHLGKPSALSGYYAGTALYSDTYTENSEEVTVYMTPERLYVGKRSGLDVTMDSASWADIVRVVNNAS